MTEFEDKHTIIRDLKIGDTFLSKSNNIGTYIKPLGDDKHLLQGHDGKQYEVPHGKFPVFKQKVTYDNTFSKKGHRLRLIDKKVAYEFIRVYHYLGDAKFFSKFAYGLYKDGSDDLLGVATFSNPQGNVALKGWFGLPNTDQTVLELSRLCLLPELNGTNATSYLLSNSIKLLKKEGIRSVITLADDSRHKGSIYQVCNFTYYGLTDKKSDFFSFTDGGKVNPRGATKDKQGVWIPRTQKHRYAYIMDKNLICNYMEQEKPKKGDNGVYDCCDGTHMVTDKRFNINYTCPKCTGKLDII